MVAREEVGEGMSEPEAGHKYTYHDEHCVMDRIVDSLYCTPETNITLHGNYTLIKTGQRLKASMNQAKEELNALVRTSMETKVLAKMKFRNQVGFIPPYFLCLPKLCLLGRHSLFENNLKIVLGFCQRAAWLR